MRRQVWVLLLGGLGVGASCTFPDVLIAEGEGGGATGGGGSATTTTTAGGTAQVGGAGGAGGLGGGGTGGSGGSGGCANADGDPEVALPCGTDCNDNDAQVYDGQTDYFGEPIGGVDANGYDYDCSGDEEPEFETVPCSGAVCAIQTGVFFGSVARPCGDTAEWGDCSALCVQTVVNASKRIECR